MVQDQLGASIMHDDGAKMTYDILGVRHLGKKIPIVLIGGATSLRGDWERLANALKEVRPVLLLDHRGMGESTFSTVGDEEITIELYARDVLDLLVFLQWKELAICGFSMGGAITQQLLLLPHHPSNPTSLPFVITHVFLAATLPKPMRDKRYGLKIGMYSSLPENGRKRTAEERKEIARPVLERTFDEGWLEDPRNKERFEALLERMTHGRPTRTILMQTRTLNNLTFHAPHSLIPRSIPILVIHGQNDLVLPFSCGQDLLSLIPHAEALEVGPHAGQVPSLAFGHQWFEYFDVQVWVDIFERFMNRSAEKPKL